MFAILVSDLHLTDRKADEYRWQVFEQIAEISNEHGISDLFILGDLTEFKDYHSSRLVNRLVDALYKLRRTSRIIEVYILKGNHDGLDPDLPYFKFLQRLPWAHFFIEPTRFEKGSDTILFLPHTRNPAEDWAAVEMDADYIFFHGTIIGAVSETGQKLGDGIPADLFKGLRATILGGDIHVPQKVGGAEYVGAPYHIRFGDSFVPRAVVVEGKNVHTVELANTRKMTCKCTAVSQGTDFDQLRKGDHVRVIISLTESQLGEFQDIKKWATEAVALAGAHLQKVQLEKVEAKKLRISRTPTSAGLSREAAFQLYCKNNKVESALVDLGQALLEDKS